MTGSTEKEKRQSIFSRFKRYADLTDVGPIARRYFVLNAFDGALTTLGILIGLFLAGISQSNIVIVTTLATALAMGVSGIWGAYLAERAERLRELKELEEQIKTDLSQTIIGKASRFAMIFSALIDGLAPPLTAIIGIIPYFFGLGNGVDYHILFGVSVSLNLSILFLLGMFLGRISQENIIWMGVKVALAGILITVILLLINLLG
jgi:predicted membrane protein (TIGR00267 family)